MATFNVVNLMVYDGTTSAAKRMTSGLGAGNTLDFGAGAIAATSFVGALSGNASTATALATGRNFSASGDASASAVSFDGTGAVDLSLTLATVLDGSSGKVPGAYGSASSVPTFTVDAKGRVTVVGSANISIDHNAISDWATATGGFLTSSSLSSYVQNTRKVLGDGSTTAHSGSGELSSDVTISLKSGIVTAASKGGAGKALSITVDTYGRVTSLSEENISILASQISDLSSQGFLTAGDITGKAGLADTQTFTGTNTFSGPVYANNGLNVQGALVVDGPIISEGVTNLNVEDAFINLRDGGVADAAGGLVVNVGEADAVAAENGIVFVAKNNTGPVRAYFTTADSTTYTGDELLQVVGSTSNNGFYGIASIEYPAGNAPGGGQGKIYIRSIDIDSAASVPFLHNNFTSENGVASVTKIRHVKATVIATSNGAMASAVGTLPLGVPCTASGSHFSDFAPTANGVGGWASIIPGVVPSSNGVAAVGELLDPSSINATNVTADSRYAVEFVALGDGLVHSGRGLPVRVKLADDVGSVSKGEMLFLGTAGRAVKTAPTANGTVVVEIGRAAKNKYSDGTVLVWFNPKLVIFNESV